MDSGWTEFAKEIGGYVGVALATLLLTLCRKMRVAVVIFLKRMWTTHADSPSKEDAEQNRRIHMELVELRVLSDSDRAYVMRFHNGNEFLPDNPVWKVTCTHEVVRPGVSYESANIQGIIVSRVHNLVDPVINGDDKYAGISHDGCKECPSKVKCDKVNKRIVVVQVDEMDNSFGKFMLEGQNIKTVIQAGIVGMGGRVFGIVGVDFCNAKKTDPVSVRETVQMVCRAAEKVQYYLHYREAPSGAQ